MSTEWTATARCVFPVDRPPLERGTVTIREGRIVAVEPAGQRSANTDFGNAAILPGLVNTHTHLDLSGLRGQCPPGDDFIAWLRAVIRHRRAMTPEQTCKDIDAGLAECLRFGTTLVGDISGQGQSWSTLSQAPIRAIVFHELLGLTVERARQAWDDMLERLPWRAETSACRAGLSPHAPTAFASRCLKKRPLMLGRAVPVMAARFRWQSIWRKAPPKWSCWLIAVVLLSIF